MHAVLHSVCEIEIVVFGLHAGCSTDVTFSSAVVIQDLAVLTNPSISQSGSVVAQNIWDVVESRWGFGTPSLLLMLVPLGAIWFCGVLSITSASRC